MNFDLLFGEIYNNDKSSKHCLLCQKNNGEDIHGYLH